MEDVQVPAPLRILVIEDEPRYLESTRLLLTHYGHAVTTAMDGAQARVALNASRFDVVLLDLRLPDTTGLELMNDQREAIDGAMVIVVSGDISIDSAISALKQGAYDFLRKPYEPELLIKTLRNAARQLTLKRENSSMQSRLEQSEQWHRFLVNSSPDILYTLDVSGKITYLNDSVEKLTGIGRAELLGQPWTALVFGEDQQDACWRVNERRTGNRATRNHELRLRRRPEREGSGGQTPYVTVELSALGMYHKSGDDEHLFAGTYGVARDISERKKAEATITFQAYHDLLTGLPNRSLFKDRLGQAIANAHRHGIILAIMFLDLDRFKVVNDTLGHLVGDELLQMSSQRLRNCLREGDTLARIGGDEFMVLLPHIRSRDNASQIAQKILTALKAPFLIGDHELYISASIGIAVHPDDGDSMETLIKHADIAMYSAKEHGRNDFRFFDQELNLGLNGRLAVEGDLRRALQRQEIEVYYQPQVDMRTGNIVGMEALARWQHPSRGMVLPTEFIPIAEDSGLISPLSERVMQAACSQVGLWRHQSGWSPTLAINLSARQIEHPQFVEHFSRILHEHGISGEGIEIEITESTLMRDQEGAIDKLKRLADMGVVISIDDFGTGYSSLSSLKKLPVHTIKIDRSFVQDLGANSNGSNGSSIVAGIAAMAKGLKLNLTAEGVETQEQLDYLRSIGCDAYQGYLFSRPLNALDAARILSSAPLRACLH